MRIEILSIGDELLDGRVTDTNTVRLAQALSTVGLHLSQRTSVTDDLSTIIREATAIAGRGTQLCVVSGGLGPTRDDLTAEAFAQLLQVPQVRDPSQEAGIVAMLERINRPVTPNQLKQADRPQGAELLPNSKGTAPGFAVLHQGCRFVAVPGVPNEFDAMIEAAVIGPLRSKQPPVARRGVYCFGLAEGQIDRQLLPIAERWPRVRLQYRVRFPEVHVTMHAPTTATDDLAAAWDFAVQELKDAVYSTTEDSFGKSMLDLLMAQQATLAVAESCTGGLVTDMLTDIAGSSAVVQLGVVVYSNEAKIKLLGVSPTTLATHGAVSEAVVLEMARGARSLSGATYAVSLSGIAGPGGGTADKPVGTVWLAGVGPQCEVTHKLTLPFDRRQNKLVSGYSSLDLLRRKLLFPVAEKTN